MKRLAVFPIALFLAVASGWAEEVTPSERATNGLQVRAEPSRDSDTVGSIDPGETARLVARVPRWYHVELDDGTLGYVSKSWAVVLPESDPRVELSPRLEDELRIHFFNIGAGTCTLVECPGKHARPIVVDCGQHFREEKVKYISHGQLQDRFKTILGSTSPDVVLSHDDHDHYNLIPKVLEGVKVNEIWQGGNPKRYNQNEFPDWLKSANVPAEKLHDDLAKNWHNQGNPISDGLDCGSASVYVLTVNPAKPRVPWDPKRHAYSR